MPNSFEHIDGDTVLGGIQKTGMCGVRTKVSFLVGPTQIGNLEFV